MNSITWSKCVKITSDLLKEPLNAFFSNRFIEIVQSFQPIDQNLNYISLNTVVTKFNNKEYKSISEWYNDVILVYQNAIKYSQNEKVKLISQYLLDCFKKKTYTIILDAKQWNEEIIKLSNEINEIIEKSPVPQGIDPFIMGIINYSSQGHQLTLPQTQWTVNTINELCKNPDHLYDIYYILKKTKSDFDQSSKTISIDFDNLNPVAMNSLFLYAISYSQDNPDLINQIDIISNSSNGSEIQPINPPQQQIVDQKPPEKVVQANNTKKDNGIKVTPSHQPQIKQNNPSPPNLQINQIIQYNLQNKLMQSQQELKNQINSQNIQNLVKQLNQKNFPNQPDSAVQNNVSNAAK